VDDGMSSRLAAMVAGVCQIDWTPSSLRPEGAAPQHGEPALPM
jgi:hypothetical protein